MPISEETARQLTEQYYESIYKFCCARCRNKETAEDITQETFKIFYGKRKNLVNTDIRAYLFTTANLLLKENFRKLKKEESFIELDECSFTAYEDDFSESLTEEEFEELLSRTQKKILGMLSPSERQIFMKLYIEKKSVRLVAAETGITENNVRVKAHRIRNKSKRIISSTELFTLVILFKLFY